MCLRMSSRRSKRETSIPCGSDRSGISKCESVPTPTVRFANERHNNISNVTADGHEVRRFFKPPLMRNPSGCDVVAAQTVHARTSYEHGEIRFGQRCVDVLGTSEDGRTRIDYGRFHDT